MISDSSAPSPIRTWVLGAALVLDLGLLFIGLLTGNTMLILLGVLALVSGSFVAVKVLGDRTSSRPDDHVGTKPSK